jgi:hypothetical protein
VKPLLSDQALKQATVRDYKRWAERAGQSVDAQALDRLAVADLELADNYDRSAKPAVPSAPDPEREQAARKSLDAEAAESGAEIVTGKMVKREIASLHAKSIPGSKWSYAMGRLARILARPNLPSRKPWEDCEIPRLAKRVYELKAFVLFRHMEKVGDQVNPLFGLSAVDFERKFRAMTIQICDESTGRLGTWWTPK